MVSGQVDPTLSELPETALWLAVLERALFDLRWVDETITQPVSSPLIFIRRSPIIETLGINPLWLESLVRKHRLIGNKA